MKGIVLFGLLLAASPAFGQSVHKCVAADGSTIYQSDPCPDGQQAVKVWVPEVQSRPALSPAAQGDLAARYAGFMHQAISRRWNPPDSVQPGQRCRVFVDQRPGGQVTGVEFDTTCPFDEAGRRALRSAIFQASPLPYVGFEPVFSRRLNLNVVAPNP